MSHVKDEALCPFRPGGHHRTLTITVPAGTQIWIAAGITDLQRGFTGLSAAVQTTLDHDPFGGHVFVFRGRRGGLIKVLWWDGDGLGSGGGVQLSVSLTGTSAAATGTLPPSSPR